MIRLCLTRVAGTTTLGLYRGLKIKTAGTEWSARVDDADMDSFDRWHLPAIVTVKMSGHQDWLGRVGHSIVIFDRRADGGLDVGDPFTGRQVWSRRQLAEVFGGEVFSLIRRK